MAVGGTDLLGGRYELGELLGSGGTGSVWRAHDRVLDRTVAVKRLRPGQDTLVRARLRAEARLAGGLHHPGIAQVFDYGEEPTEHAGGDPAPYLVLEHVEGDSLWHVLRERGPLPPAEAMRLVAQVADALQAAHDAGIVHRDLKPGNILITPLGRAVLVDFGIARTLEAEPLTMTGTIVGTVDYISPEQGAGQSATALSDVYSLGMVAYECLTGHKPFRRETPVATALAHLNEEVPPPDGVPDEVRDLVLQMVAKRPDDRPSSAAEVAVRASALAAAPGTARQPGRRRGRPARPSRLRAGQGRPAPTRSSRGRPPPRGRPPTTGAGAGRAGRCSPARSPRWRWWPRWSWRPAPRRCGCRTCAR